LGKSRGLAKKERKGTEPKTRLYSRSSPESSLTWNPVAVVVPVLVQKSYRQAVAVVLVPVRTRTA
jgi:hypothetical protein